MINKEGKELSFIDLNLLNLLDFNSFQIVKTFDCFDVIREGEGEGNEVMASSEVLQLIND